MKSFYSGFSLVIAGAIASLLLITSCSSKSGEPNTVTEAEKKEGWILLFDGHSLAGWHVYHGNLDSSAWAVTNGEIVCNPHAKDIIHGDLVTDSLFTNFDFRFEWKITKGGNSGVYINVQESPDNPTAWVSGPEYQLLDNDNSTDHNYKDTMRQAGCLYGLAGLKNKAWPRPFGEWNESRIVQENGKITFWLNGVLSAEEDMRTERWNEQVKASSLGKFPNFGQASEGRLGLQDWIKGVSFRSIKIRRL